MMIILRFVNANVSVRVVVELFDGTKNIMDKNFLAHLEQSLSDIREQGLLKPERVIESPQQASIFVHEQDVINLCANNYLGLANHPFVLETAKKALEEYGYGMASVRFICGTQSPHKKLEKKSKKKCCGKRRQCKMNLENLKDLGYFHRLLISK